MVIKTCEYCQKEFETNWINEKYCHWRCKDRAEGKYLKECSTCGKEFKTNYFKSKYCTEECKPIYEKVCCRCGKVYTTKEYHPQSYCSDECKESTLPQLYKCLDSDGQVVFIGCTVNLNKAMGKQYKIEDNTFLNEVNEIYIHNASGDIDRILKEIYLIRKYKPKYRECFNTNEQHKEIKDLEVDDWELIYKK